MPSPVRFFRPLSSSVARSAAAASASYRPSVNSRLFHTTPANMVVHDIKTNEDFYKAINNPEKPLVVVDCFATWCGPCKAIAPILVKLSDQFTDINFVKIDVDELSDLSRELGVRAMPTFILFKNGEKASEVVGADPKKLQNGIQALAS